MGSTMSEPRRYGFEIEGVRMVGNLYVPTAAKAPAVAVITGPLTSVKEQAAGAYARALAERGLIALAFDHRTFGESGGEPRQFENPFAKVRDVKGAASALLADRDLPDVPLLGVGVCAGAGYMARAVSEDSRFQGFAAVAGYFSEVTDQSIESARTRSRGLGQPKRDGRRRASPRRFEPSPPKEAMSRCRCERLTSTTAPRVARSRTM